MQLNKFTGRNGAATSQVKYLQGCLNWVYWVKERIQHSDGKQKQEGIAFKKTPLSKKWSLYFWTFQMGCILTELL